MGDATRTHHSVHPVPQEVPGMPNGGFEGDVERLLETSTGAMSLIRLLKLEGC